MTPNEAYWYAKDVLKHRWPEAKPLIMKSKWAVPYMLRAINGNWAYEGEEMWWILQAKN